MRQLIILVVILVVAGSCSGIKDKKNPSQSEKNKQVIIEGSIRGGQGKEILIDEMGAAEFIATDTFTVSSDGSFLVKFNSDHPAFYALRSATSGYITLIASPGDSLHLEAAWDTLIPYKVEGSLPSSALLDLALEHRLVLDKLGDVSARVRKASTEPGFREAKEKLDEEFDELINGFHSYSEAFIRKNGSSLANLPALYNQYGPGLPVFNPESDFSMYELVDSLLFPAFQMNEAVKALHLQVENARILMQEAISQNLKEGDIAPAFVAKNSKGEKISLPDYRGHYLILNFWAAWSKPSLDQNTYLKKAWEKYHSSGLEILQVSLDDDRELWLKAINDSGLDWENVSDLSRWDSPIAAIYHIDRIPYSLLIDPQGKILELDLYGDELLQKTSTLFSK